MDDKENLRMQRDPAARDNHDPQAARPPRGWLPAAAIVAGLVGFVLIAWGFLTGVMAALNGTGNAPWIAVFVCGAALSVATIVTAVVGLRRPGHRVAYGIALGIGLLPVGLFLLLLINSRG